jgi:hypothetical protein
MKRIVFVFCAVVLLLIIADYSAAELDITPGVGLREEYHDNIFLTRTDHKSDFITKIFPSIALKYSLRPLDLSLDYRLDFKFYSRYNNLNETSLGDTQTLRFQSQLRPVSRVFIDVSDVYERVPIDIRRQVAFENMFVNLTDKNIFSISPYVEYPLSPTLLSRFGYRFTDVWYKAEEGNDADSHLAFLSFEKRLSPNLTTALKYDYMVYKTQRTNDYDRHQGSVAITYQKGSDLTFKGEVGEAYFDYSVTDNRTGGFWNVSADYALRAIGGVTLGTGYSSSFYDSVTTGVYKTKRLDLRVKIERYLKLSANPYYSIDKYLEMDRKDKVTGVTINLSKQLSQKMAFSIRGLWERQKFLPEGKKVNRYSAAGSLDYKLSPRLTASIGYTHNNKNSNIDTDDFHSNVVWLQSRFTF